MNLYELNKPNNRTAQILTESSYQTLTETQKIYLNRWEKELWPLLEEYTRLAEATLTPDQIQDIFKGAEQRAMDSGDNKTIAGKVGSGVAAAAKLPVDMAKKVDAKINELGKMAQNAGPVKNADAKFEQLKKDITAKNGDSKIVQGIQKVSDWAKENPGKASLAVGILTAIAAFAGGPVGGAAAGLILRSTKELLQGEKLSSAVGKSIKTAAYGAIAGWALNGIGDWFEGLRYDAVPYEKAPGLVQFDVNFTETFSGPGFTMKETIGSMVIPESEVGRFTDLLNTMKEATASGATSNSAALDAFSEMSDFVDTFDAQWWLDSNKIANDIAQAIAAENDAFLQNMTAINSGISALAQGTVSGKIDAKDVKVGGEPVQGELDLQGGSGTKNTESVDYETAYRYMLNEFIAEADPEQGELPLDNPNTLGAKMKRGLGKAASKVAAGVKQVGKDLGNKVTANKLNKKWKEMGEPTDAGTIAFILQDAGMSPEDIKAIGQEQEIDLGDAKNADGATDATQASTSGGKDADATADGSGDSATQTSASGERRATKDEIAKWIKKDAGLVDPKNPAADGDIEATRDGRNIGLVRQANNQDHIWLGASWVDMATGKSVSADTQGLGRPDLEELAKQIQKANIAKLVKGQLTSPGIQGGTKQAQQAAVTKTMTSKKAASAGSTPAKNPRPDQRFQKNV